MSFREYITESKFSFGKLQHLEHNEDLIFHDDAVGYNHAKETLHAVHDRIQGKPTASKISTKYDGSPAIVFGHCPKTGKFFVGTKAALSQIPKLNFTAADLRKNYGDKPGLHAALHHALTHMPKVTPSRGIYQGDLMYTGDTVHQDDHHYHFTPNTLMYSVKKDTPEGQKIKQSKMGIVVHTKYHGNDLGSMVAGFEPDLHKFKKSKDVHMIDPQVHIDKTLGGPDVEKQFLKHMSAAEMARLKAHPTMFKDTVGHREHLKKYINDTVRSGDKPTAMGLRGSLTASYKREADKLKTPLGRLRKKEQLQQHLSHIDNHHERYQSLLDIHHHLQQAKHVLLGALDQTNPYETSVDGKDVAGEGFVTTHHAFPTKLVNRSEFSKLNFAKSKNRKG